MKVLFAVSNENISEAIIKRYPKEYKEILSYKNVYYFDAILKEIQRDKSYDRIVISEDLEPFINTNHDSIDNFIFDHLDKISDEAHDNEGKETAIILICSERRSPGSSILNKLFSIGVYNAVMGKDRNLQELCKLINRPRNKKEAKIYYRIDQATYDPVVENEVNEVEIQNILTHFKKLGKNTERYADSFNNIAAQYTDEQLKIIINVLPMKVKAVLESESPKYQSLMGSVVASEAKKIREVKEPGIKVNTIGKGTKVNGPIVIPSSVKKVVPKTEVASTNNPKVVNTTKISANQVNASQVAKVQAAKPQSQVVKPQMASQVAKAQVQSQTVKVAKPEISSQKINSKPVEPIIKEKAEESVENINNSDEELFKTEQTEVKRGRGRPPKKAVVQNEPNKPKGKRGRPPKNLVQENIEEDKFENVDDEVLLPGLEESLNEENDFAETNEKLISDVTEDGETLPGLEDFDEIEAEENSEFEVEGTLPGLEEDEAVEEDTGEEVDVSNLLSQLDETEESEEEEGLLPGLEEDSSIEDNDTLDSMEEEELLPGLEDSNDIEMPEEDALPGLEDNYEEEALSGLDEAISDIDNLDENLSSIDETEKETILPGMGFEDEAEEETNLKNENQNSNIVDTVKSKVNYSMSNLNSLLSKDKKIVTFIGTTKNGTSFLINNLALMFSLMGIDTAILDMTKNRNSYYIFTNNLEELRKVAHTSIGKLENGYADGIKVNKNFTVYTAMPDDGNKYENAEPILSTLVQNHSLILIDCDFDTSPAYFASCQEIYLVQSMDILTIQPLTEFIRGLKFKNAWEPEKARVVINKETKVRGLNGKMIIAGMSRYNGPDMSVMTDLFNKDMIKACSIPFDEKVYCKYLETMATCKLSLSGYSKPFMQKMQILSEMVYPSLNSKKTYGPMDNNSNIQNNNTNNNVFSNNMNNTLNQMKNKY